MTAVPFRSDFSSRQPALTTNGRIIGGRLHSGPTFCFAILRIAPSQVPLNCTVVATAENHARLSASVYELKNGRDPGKRVQILLDAAVLGRPKQRFELAVAASEVPLAVFFYNQNRCGNLIFDEISLEELK